MRCAVVLTIDTPEFRVKARQEPLGLLEIALDDRLHPRGKIRETDAQEFQVRQARADPGSIRQFQNLLEIAHSQGNGQARIKP
jgi:hypothetical protein